MVGLWREFHPEDLLNRLERETRKRLASCAEDGGKTWREKSATCGEDGLCEDLRAIESFLADAEDGIGGLEMEKWM